MTTIKHVAFFMLLQYFQNILTENLSTVVTFSKEELLLTEKYNDTRKKEALRYGFQRTHKCKSFERSFLCIRKCLDLNYDVAYADENCVCTCFFKKDKGKYKPKSRSTKATWLLGAPSTKVPAWAIPKKSSDDDTSDTDSNSEDDNNTPSKPKDNHSLSTTEANHKKLNHITTSTSITQNIKNDTVITKSEHKTTVNNKQSQQTTQEQQEKKELKKITAKPNGGNIYLTTLKLDKVTTIKNNDNKITEHNADGNKTSDFTINDSNSTDGSTVHKGTEGSTITTNLNHGSSGDGSSIDQSHSSIGTTPAANT